MTTRPHLLIDIVLWMLFIPLALALIVFGLTFDLLSRGRVSGFIR